MSLAVGFRETSSTTFCENNPRDWWNVAVPGAIAGGMCWKTRTFVRSGRVAQGLKIHWNGRGVASERQESVASER